MNQIYIHKEDQQLGPFSPEQVRDLLENGHVTPGDLAWHVGMDEWQPLGEVMERTGAAAPPDLPQAPVAAPGEPAIASGEALFHHVSPVKFVIMTLITLGLYEVWWFWRGWRDIARREGLNIWPFWRGFFAPVWFYPFATRVFEMRGRSRAGLAALLAVIYFGLTVSWRLPEPYWLISFATIIVILPVVIAVHRLNTDLDLRGPAYRRFGVPHVLVALIGTPILAYTFLSGTAVIPGNIVIEGNRLPTYVINFLHDEDLLDPGEEIVYFYSMAFLNYRSDGNYFTPRRVVSYWDDFDGFYVEEAAMSEVVDVEASFSTGPLEDTMITVTRTNGSEVILFVSPDEGGDRRFFQSLQDHWRRATSAAEPE